MTINRYVDKEKQLCPGETEVINVNRIRCERNLERLSITGFNLNESNGNKDKNESIQRKRQLNANKPNDGNNRMQIEKRDIEDIQNDREQDGRAGNESKTNAMHRHHRWEIVWTSVLVLGFFHLAGFYGATLRNEAKWQSQIFGRIIAVLSSYSVTAGAHRLWSHRSYKANAAYQLLMMLLMSFIYQNSIYTWARDHRLHHMSSETDADPHNAKRGFFFSHIGWLMVKKHPDVRRKGKNVVMTDLEANSIVMFQHRHYHKLILLNCFFIVIFVPWFFFGESLKVCFFYLTCYRLVVILNFTWGINSLAHMYGNKPYNKKIGPVENSFMSYLTFGEGFHNYHHTFPWDYKAAEYSTDGRNTTTKLIDFFAWLGWVWDRKTAPKHLILSQKHQKGDGFNNEELGWFKTVMDVGRVLLMCMLYGYVL